jgi:hypothetical protein
LQFIFEHVAEHSGANVDDSGIGVNRMNARESAKVEENSAEKRDRSTDNAASTSGGGDRNVVLVAQAQNGSDLFG